MCMGEFHVFSSTVLPPEAATALRNLNALGRLLQCVDPQRWNSLARPTAAQLGGLVLSAHAGLVEGLSEICDLPEDAQA